MPEQKEPKEQTTGTCGRTTVHYDSNCTWSCICTPAEGCHWFVSCPGGVVIDGTGIVVHHNWLINILLDIYQTVRGTIVGNAPDRSSHFGYNGTAEVIGAQMEVLTGKRIIVPEEQRHTRIRGEVDGGVIAAAKKLGFAVVDR